MKLSVLVTFNQTSSTGGTRYVSINSVNISAKYTSIPSSDNFVKDMKEIAESHDYSNTEEVYEELEEYILKLEAISQAYRSNQSQASAINDVATLVNGLSCASSSEFKSMNDDDDTLRSVTGKSIYTAKLHVPAPSEYLYIISERSSNEWSGSPSYCTEIPTKLTVNEPTKKGDNYCSTRCRTYKLDDYESCKYVLVSENGIRS